MKWHFRIFLLSMMWVLIAATSSIASASAGGITYLNDYIDVYDFWANYNLSTNYMKIQQLEMGKPVSTARMPDGKAAFTMTNQEDSATVNCIADTNGRLFACDMSAYDLEQLGLLYMCACLAIESDANRDLPQNSNDNSEQIFMAALQHFGEAQIWYSPFTQKRYRVVMAQKGQRYHVLMFAVSD